MEDGRMTDGQGRTVDFRNTILIMTSNIGSDWILNESDPVLMKNKVMDAVMSTFKPEFMNRLDDVVVFHRLGAEHIAQILDIQVSRLAARLSDRKLELTLTPAAKEHLAQKGYDPAFGARPLRRLIEKTLTDAIALELLKGGFPEGSTVVVDVEGEEIRILDKEKVDG
jgi:ATP-dependent Clp protease ATP-binding subunit ClpB